MSKIGSKNTKLELILRSALFKKGFRFRIHRKDLLGKPDIVLTKVNQQYVTYICLPYLRFFFLRFFGIGSLASC